MIIYVDIDETICISPEDRDYAKAVPILTNIEKCNRLYNEGHKIVYWTARGTGSGIDWREVTEKQFKELVIFENVLEAFKNYLNYDYGCVMRGHGQLVSIGLNIPCIYFSTQDKVYDYSNKNGFMDYTVDIHPHEDLDPNISKDHQIMDKFVELQILTSKLCTDKEYLAKWYDIRDNVVKNSKLKFDKFCLKVIDYIS